MESVLIALAERKEAIVGIEQAVCAWVKEAHSTTLKRLSRSLRRISQKAPEVRMSLLALSSIKMLRSSPTISAEGATRSICGGMQNFLSLSNWSKDTDMLRLVTMAAIVLEIRAETMAPE